MKNVITRVSALNRVCPSVCPSVRPSGILLARRFVRHVIGRKGGREVSSLSLSPLGNILGTQEPIGHLKGTQREQRKNEKNPPPTPSTQKLKETKSLNTHRGLDYLSVCSSGILLAGRFVPRVIGRKGGREVSFLSLSPLGNTLRTQEPIGHLKGTQKAQRKNEKNPPPTLSTYGREEFGEGGSWGDEEWRMWKLQDFKDPN